jgi:uncharacterized protein (TIGR00297 family)
MYIIGPVRLPQFIFIHRDFSLTSIEVIHLLWVAAGIFALLLAAESIRRIRHWPEEFSRKFVHVATGLLVFAAPLLFKRAEPILLISAAFTLLDFLAYRFGLLHAVHQVNRSSYGTVYYPLSLFILAYFLWDSAPGIVVASILVMAIGDGAAGITGELIRQPLRYRITSDEKSMQGSMLMFLASFAVLNIAALAYGSSMLHLPVAARASPLLLALTLASVSLFATVWEASCSRGTDNLSVPLMTALALYFCLSDPADAIRVQWLWGVALGGAVAVASLRLKFLQLSGAFGAFLLACVVFGIGGWKWTVPIVTFFVLSSALSRFGRTRKSMLAGIYEKSGTRDIWQVAANGGVAGAIVLLSFFFPHQLWYFLYLGSLAAVTADTWGTEIGSLSPSPPRSVLTWRHVERGASGGITPLGTAAGLLGAVLVALSAAPFLPGPNLILCFVAVAGVIGSIADSLLGATLQAQYRCDVCGKTTERVEHCGAPSLRMRGRSAVNNDVVNVCAAVAGALLVLLFSRILV